MFSCVQLSETSQSPLSMGFSRQEYWSGFTCPPPEDLPDPGIELMSPVSPTLAGKLFTAEQQGKPIEQGRMRLFQRMGYFRETRPGLVETLGRLL